MSGVLLVIADGQGGVVTLEQAVACGYSPDEVARLCASGRWTRLRRAVYLPGPAPAAATDPIRRHVLDAAAALLSIGAGDAVVAQISGAALWGLDFIDRRPPLPEVVLARPVPGVVRRYPGLRVLPVTLPADHVVTGPGGLRTCTAARVVVDLARRLPTRDVVVFGDSALRKRLATRTEIDRVLADCEGWPGTRRAARRLALLDERSESAAESLARLTLIAGGFRDFESQVKIRDARGVAVARVDFLVSRRVAVEPDGQLKYTDPDALWKEKLREDAIRDLGFEVVRLTWAEVERVDHVRKKVQAALARSMRRFPDPPNPASLAPGVLHTPHVPSEAPPGRAKNRPDE